ncbi:MAG: BlaI/MecI/CopY family transcriptional regulator [Candidatus Riflebacteria bacterium]|nr:BlaI/MecI/CopY family transcriptional regulator [Candidatus Riflebacteria bacterium]
MKRQSTLGRAELEILKVVTDHHPVTVRDVADHVSRTKGGARTTVLTVMERLRQKGYLTRKKVEGTFRYSPRVPMPQLLRRLVRDFVEKVLGGSLAPFVAYMARDARVSGDELEELRRLVSELDDRRQESRR